MGEAVAENIKAKDSRKAKRNSMNTSTGLKKGHTSFRHYRTHQFTNKVDQCVAPTTSVGTFGQSISDIVQGKKARKGPSITCRRAGSMINCTWTTGMHFSRTWNRLCRTYTILMGGLGMQMPPRITHRATSSSAFRLDKCGLWK